MTKIESTNAATQLFRDYLHQIVAEMLFATAELTAGTERLRAALAVYWDANAARRDQRKLIVSTARNAGIEIAYTQLGRPFQHMLELELRTIGAPEPETLAATMFEEAQAIAVAECETGKQESLRRDQLLASIRSLDVALAE